MRYGERTEKRDSDRTPATGQDRAQRRRETVKTGRAKHVKNKRAEISLHVPFHKQTLVNPPYSRCKRSSRRIEPALVHLAVLRVEWSDTVHCTMDDDSATHVLVLLAWVERDVVGFIQP